MKAILKFGTLSQEINVPDARMTVSIIKPTPLNTNYKAPTEINPAELVTKRLEFILTSSPYDEPLVYEFSGEL